jgi:RimJ/RimL family protein N-acetyltransferase
MHPDFDPQPTLTGDTLTLRPMRADDLEPLYTVAKDPEIWVVHPVPNRHERTPFESFFQTLLGSNQALTVTHRATGEIIGCSRYYATPDVHNSISIGFTFLGRTWWGGVTNFEMKRLMLDHAFVHVDAVWLHIAPVNIRSQRATAKLGAVHAYDSDLFLGGATALWQSWRVDAQAWEHVKAAKAGA